MTSSLLLAGVLAASSTSPISDPTDVRGVIRGAQAVSTDPAGAATVDGVELSMRNRLDEPSSDQQWGLYGVLPLGPASLALGYEWLRSSFDFRRAPVGLGFRLSRAVSVGLDYRWLHRVRGDSTTAWDASILAMPASWLSLALGVEQMNEPHFAGVLLPRTTWVGAGVRPWRGLSWLTLGGEADLRLEKNRRVLDAPRLVADVEPVEGLHARVAWAPDDHEVWASLAVSLVGLEARADAGRDSRDFGGSGPAVFELTWRQEPSESLLSPRGRTIEVPITGKLTPRRGLLGVSSSVSEVPLALVAVAGDPTVSRVVLDIGDLDVGTSEVEELRAAIKALRASGKTVVAELAGGSEKEYLVAAACDRIRLDPAASLVLDGYSVTLVYLADTLAKVGVRFDAVGIGRYKTAPDQLTRNGPRPEEREVQGGILSQLYESFVRAVVEDRHLKVETVQEVLARGIVTPADALRLGLADELSQPTDPKMLPVAHEMGEALETEAGASPRWGTPPTIAILPLVGNITSSGAAGVLPGGAADAARLVSELDDLRTDGSVKAVVLRVDSPGGEVYASEVIWRSVRLLAAQKPVVVSMGEVAASGGYYVATPAHVILAEPSTVTGSIGIFMVKPDLSGLLKLTGAHAEIMQMGPHASWSSPLSALTDEERAIVKSGLAVDYDTFLQHVADGRHLPIERVRALAEGRVYTGTQALALGLVDGIGGLAEAVVEARDRAGLKPGDDVDIRVVEEPLSLATALGSLGEARPGPADALVDGLRRIEALGRVPLARLPFEVIVR